MCKFGGVKTYKRNQSNAGVLALATDRDLER